MAKTLTIHERTILKQSTAQSSTLTNSHKAWIQPGTYKLNNCYPTAAGHWVVQFVDAIPSIDGSRRFYSWWIYLDDRVSLSANSGFKVLPVSYASQLDNKQEPHRQCNTSCCWMLLNYFKPGVRRTDDEYFAADVKPLGDTTDHWVQTRALAKHGVITEFKYDLDFNDLREEIDQNSPVVIGILHRGTQAAPTGGHMILVIGYEGNDWICHDPFGVLPYSTWASGRSVKYSTEMLAARWLPDGPRTGWGRIVL